MTLNTWNVIEYHSKQQNLVDGLTLMSFIYISNLSVIQFYKLLLPMLTHSSRRYAVIYCLFMLPISCLIKYIVEMLSHRNGLKQIQCHS